MAGPPIVAREHDEIPIATVPISGALTPDEAERLFAHSEKRPGLCQVGRRSVRLANYGGIVNLGTRVLEILPKIEDYDAPARCRTTLMKLLAMSGEFRAFAGSVAPQRSETSPLLETFVACFFDEVTTLIRGGLLHQYRVLEDDLGVLRGRIDVRRQFTVLSGRPDRLACRYDDLAADNPWNRAIKAGIEASGAFLRGTAMLRRWNELRIVFDEVPSVRLRANDLDRLVYDRQAERYRAAMDWSRRILAMQSPSFRGGDDAAPGLLFDLNALFEKAVARWMRRSLASTAPDVRVLSQHDRQYLASTREDPERPAFRLRPDLLLVRGDTPLLIADTKWKVVSTDRRALLRPDSADIYQMHAYASAYNCGRLALVYPWHDGLKTSRETAFVLPPVGRHRPEVSIVCLDLRESAVEVRRGARALDLAEPAGAVRPKAAPSS